MEARNNRWDFAFQFASGRRNTEAGNSCLFNLRGANNDDPPRRNQFSAHYRDPVEIYSGNLGESGKN